VVGVGFQCVGEDGKLKEDVLIPCIWRRRLRVCRSHHLHRDKQLGEDISFQLSP
jgi:hypothetical protein